MARASSLENTSSCLARRLCLVVQGDPAWHSDMGHRAVSAVSAVVRWDFAVETICLDWQGEQADRPGSAPLPVLRQHRRLDAAGLAGELAAAGAETEAGLDQLQLAPSSEGGGAAQDVLDAPPLRVYLECLCSKFSLEHPSMLPGRGTRYFLAIFITEHREGIRLDAPR